jgi:hypothetical protein
MLLIWGRVGSFEFRVLGGVEEECALRLCGIRLLQYICMLRLFCAVPAGLVYNLMRRLCSTCTTLHHGLGAWCERFVFPVWDPMSRERVVLVAPRITLMYSKQLTKSTNIRLCHV